MDGHQVTILSACTTTMKRWQASPTMLANKVDLFELVIVKGNGPPHGVIANQYTRKKNYLLHLYRKEREINARYSVPMEISERGTLFKIGICRK